MSNRGNRGSSTKRPDNSAGRRNRGPVSKMSKSARSQAIQVTNHRLAEVPKQLRKKVLKAIGANRAIPAKVLDRIGMMPVSGRAARDEIHTLATS